MTTTVAPSELFTAWQAWHQNREAELATEHGWLSITGFHWLPETPTALGDLPGRWSADGDHAILTASSDDGLGVASGIGTGQSVDGTITSAVAEAGSLQWIRRGDILVELVLRGGRYAIRVRDPRGPERLAFNGVPAFDVDPQWIRPGRFVAYPEPERVTVDTARSDLRQQVAAVGTVTLDISGRQHTLVATAGQRGRVNLSFRDTTSGRQTAPWRVVSTSVPTEYGDLVVDFNRTVNLPFAFTEFGTAPPRSRATICRWRSRPASSRRSG